MWKKPVGSHLRTSKEQWGHTFALRSFRIMLAQVYVWE